MTTQTKLTKSPRLWMIFSALSLSSKWTVKTIDPKHPYIVLDFTKKICFSTENSDSAIDSGDDRGWNVVQELCSKIH